MGALKGAATGFTGGFISSAGNAWINKSNFGEGIQAGLKGGAFGAVTGATIGSITGGIHAAKKDLNIFTGEAHLDLSNGLGAHGNIDSKQAVLGKWVGEYQNVDVYESGSFKVGQGMALPGRGIIVSGGAFTRNLDPWLMKHEFGHILQARNFGYSKFYGHIAPRSAASAARNGVDGWLHREYWTEVMANQLSADYFHIDKAWPRERFPLEFKNLDWQMPFYFGIP